MELDKVYEIYYKDIYNYIYSISKNKAIAEDIAQETFLKALKNMDSYDGSKDIQAWLFTIAKNTYFTYCNRQKIYVDTEDLERIQDNRKDVLENIVLNEQAMLIHKYLHIMDEPYKEVFMLRFFGELSYDKIGIIFGKSAGWARVTFYRAKKQLLDRMEEQENEKS